MLKSIGSLMFILGVAAIIFGFMDRVPRLLAWIYEWGNGAAWAIKIGLVVGGAALYLMSSKSSSSSDSNPPAS
jgi:hypothetical protein